MPLTGFQFTRLISVPRPSERAGDDGTAKALSAGLRAAHQRLAGGADRAIPAAGQIAMLWLRTRAGGPLNIYLGGQPFFPLAPPACAHGQDGPLLFPPGAQCRVTDLAEITDGLDGLRHWVRCLGVAAAPAEDPAARASEPTGRRSRFDAALAHLGTPFAWLVVAEAVHAVQLQGEQSDLAARIPRLRLSENSEDSRLTLAKAQARYRLLVDGSSTGLWSVRVLAGAGSEDAALRAGAILSSSVELDRVDHVLTSEGYPSSLTQAATSTTTATPSRDAPASAFTVDSRVLAAVMTPPREEIAGIETRSLASFDMTVTSSDPTDIPLATILDRMGQGTGRFAVPRSTLNRHAFVAGATGSGKSHTVRSLLEGLARADPPVPWLVIEPAKAEYTAMAGRVPEQAPVLAIRPGDLAAAPAGLNPLEPEPGFPLQSHLDLVRALFAAAFEAEEPFPQVLAKAMTACYTSAGWNLRTGHHRGTRALDGELVEAFGGGRYPTLADLQAAARQVVTDIGYGPEVTSNIRGFVDVRIGSLRSGTPGAFFEDGHPLDIGELIHRNVVLELEDITDDADKAFVMGTILIRLVEHLRVHRQLGSDQLTHVLVIEEAHRLLKKTDGGAAAAAVELFASLLAEIRAYGEGVVIAEQIPAKIMPDVIKNSAFKVLHRLPAKDDREAVGATMNLQPAQSEAIVALTNGYAAVAIDGMDQPMLVRVDFGKDRESPDRVERAPPFRGRRSASCGPECARRACTLSEIDRACTLSGGPIALWIDLRVVSLLTLQLPPGPGPATRSALANVDARSIECAIATACGRAVAGRRIALHPLVDTAALEQISAATARTVLAGEPEPALVTDLLRSLAVGPHRYADIADDLEQWRLATGPDGPPAPLKPEWLDAGLRIPPGPFADQLSAVRDHPTDTRTLRRAIAGDIDVTGARAAVLELTGGDTMDHLRRAARSACDLEPDRLDFLLEPLVDRWTSTEDR